MMKIRRELNLTHNLNNKTFFAAQQALRSLEALLRMMSTFEEEKFDEQMGEVVTELLDRISESAVRAEGVEAFDVQQKFEGKEDRWKGCIEEVKKEKAREQARGRGRGRGFGKRGQWADRPADGTKNELSASFRGRGRQ